MADQINVTGLVTVQCEWAANQGIQTLGESMDMVQIDHQAFSHNVPGDRHGGPQGPPIEKQYLGEIVRIQLELSRWDPAVWDILRKRQANATLGKVALTEVGKLMLESNRFRLILNSTTRPLNFPCCVVLDTFQYAMGSKFTAVSALIEAHRVPSGGMAGVLYNSDTGAYTSW